MTAAFMGGPLDGERRLVSEPPAQAYYAPVCFVAYPTPLQHPMPRYRHVYKLAGMGSGKDGPVALYRYDDQEVH